MTRKSTIGAAAAALLALVAAGCGRAEDGGGEAQALARARIPLADAVARAAGDETQGVAWEAEIALEDGRPAYRIEFISKEGAVRVVVDAENGAVLARQEVALDADERALADELLAAGGRRVDLAEASRRALADTPGGRVAEVDVEEGFDGPVYVIRTVAGGTQREVEVPALEEASGAPAGEGEGTGG